MKNQASEFFAANVEPFDFEKKHFLKQAKKRDHSVFFFLQMKIGNRCGLPILVFFELGFYRF